jgi:hypothetical protein
MATMNALRHLLQKFQHGKGTVHNHYEFAFWQPGSRTKTQRMQAGGRPPWYQTAIPEQN